MLQNAITHVIITLNIWHVVHWIKVIGWLIVLGLTAQITNSVIPFDKPTHFLLAIILYKTMTSFVGIYCLNVGWTAACFWNEFFNVAKPQKEYFYTAKNFVEM